MLDRFWYGDCLVHLAEPVHVWLSAEEHDIMVQVNISREVAKASYDTEQLVVFREVNTKRQCPSCPAMQSSWVWTTPHISECMPWFPVDLAVN